MKYAYAIVFAIFLLLMSACSGNDTKQEQIADHILTILARSTYEGPIRQAEQALIAEWAQRPDREGHTFGIELTTFSPQDELNHLTRLDTMLMAGQAYDIFFPVIDHRHIRDYALSGFIMDFYPLIENCPHSSLDAFFANALSAWEMGGGLFVFPWDFSFNYTFMNSSLPQSQIDNFAKHSYITVAELVGIYSMLLQNNEHKYGNFSFSHGSTLHHPSRVIASYLSNFIDFDNQTAHLLDTDFLTFLMNFTAAFDDRHLHGQDRQYWTHWWIHGEPMINFIPVLYVHSLRMIAFGANAFTWGTGWHSQWRWDTMYAVTMPPHAFIVESRNWFPAAAVMPENVFQPYFEPGIPLADEQGRLLIAGDTAYPAGVSISATADGAVAWDFTRHLVNAFNRRELHSFHSLFYSHSIAIPIVRDLFDFRVHTSLTNIYAYYRAANMFHTPLPLGVDIFQWMEDRSGLMLPHIATLAEMPMALTHPPIPEHLYIDNLELLLRGLITPQDFAQRTQNAVSLWLIGG